MINLYRNLIKQSIRLSLTLGIYFILFSEVGVAESSNNNAPQLQQPETISQSNETATQAQQLFNEAEKLAQQQTILSQVEAIKKWSEARLKWQRLGDKSQEALTLLKLGESYKNIGATTPALEYYTKALTIYRELNNRLQEAFTLGQIGEAYAADLERLREQNRYEQISQYSIYHRTKIWQDKYRSYSPFESYNQSLEIYQEVSNSSNNDNDRLTARQGEANILKSKAKIIRSSSSFEAERLLKRSLEIYQEIGDKQGKALVLSNLSEFNLSYGDQQIGLDLFNQAVTLYQEIAESPNYDKFTTRQAEANLFKTLIEHFWVNRLDSQNQEKALEFHDKSLKIYREIGDKQGEAQALNDMGHNYRMLEDREKQLELYNQALKIYQEIEDSVGEANTLDHIGLVYSLLGNSETALKFYNLELEALKKASQFYTQLGDSETALIFEYRQPLVAFAMGKIYAQLEDAQNEVEAYNQARTIFQKLQDYEGEIDVLIEIAGRYEKQENLERMEEFLNHAVTVYRETGNRLQEANFLRERIAGFYLYRSEPSEKGIEILNQALKIYQEIGNQAEIAETLQLIGFFYSSIDKKDSESENELEYKRKAIEFYSQAQFLYRETNNLPKEVNMLGRMGLIYYELDEKEKALEAFNQAVKIYQGNGKYEETVNTLIWISETYTKWREKETALEFYLQAIPITQQLGDYKKEANILREMGQIYYDLGNKDKAVETFNQAQKVYQKNSDPSGEAWIIERIGKIYITFGDLTRALGSYQQVLKIYEQEVEIYEREKRRLNLFIRISRIYAYLGETEKSIGYCQKSLSSAQELYPSKTFVFPAEIFMDIGKLCYQVGDTKTALESFERYWKVYQEFGLDSEVWSLIEIGTDYTELGDLKQAIYFLNQAKTIYKNSGLSEAEIDVIVQISGIYYRNQNHQKALEYLSQGLRISQQINNRSREASILTKMGDHYSDLGDEEKALELYNQALSIYKKLENYSEQTEILNKIGEMYHQSGKLEAALQYYHQALKNSAEKHQNYSTYRKIAKVYFELEYFEKALEFYQQALNIHRKQNYSSFQIEANLYIEIGKIYSSLGELEKALESFNKSLDVLKNTSYNATQSENYLGIARVERKKGNLNTALTHIKTAIALIEETRNRKFSSEERLEFFASKQDYYEFYIDLLMELHQQNPSKGYDAQALHISERSKARNLLELLTEANIDIRKGVEPELVIQERTLQQQLDAVEQRRVEIYSSENDNLEQKTAIEQERQYLLRRYEEIQTKIREKSPSYAALTQPQPLTLEQIQQQILDEDTLLLQYALGEKRSFLWAVAKNSITSYELPPKAAIEKAVRDFYRQAVISKNASPESLYKVSEALYEMILAPVSSQLNYQRLAIVSDGILHYLPFSAVSLPTDSSNKNYLPLVTNHEIVRLPSASTLSILRQDIQQREPAPKSIAILADPVYSSDDSRLQTPASTQSETWEQYNLNRSARQVDIGVWQRLPGTRTEAEAILALVAESESIYAFDFAANRTTATNPQLNQYKIIHFGTHGLLNSVNPELSGIVLSMVDQEGNSLNGFLRLHDIFNLDFSADLVVLSACKTGLGKQVRGEGLVGLTRGFMYAGTPRVLVSLWDVNDAATAEIMTRFYRLMLKEKLPPTEALRKAQLEMQTETEWKSPHYWAAFTLQGEWR